MKGFFNRLLRVDLSKQSYAYEEIPDAVLKKNLGGKPSLLKTASS
jgi:aldehyde:ferredoxin oxidoreductase